MPKEIIKIDVRDLITEHLKNDHRSLKWLHEKTQIPYGTIYSCLTERRFNLSEDSLHKINKVLGTNFNI